MFKFNIDLIIFIIEIENWLIKKKYLIFARSKIPFMEIKFSSERLQRSDENLTA